MRLLVNHAVALVAASLPLLAAAPQGVGRPALPAPGPTTGPAADYPVVIGEPFTIGTTTWTPTNQLNYDAVGQAVIDDALLGVSAAHKTLPLPSYAEITALDTGRTILVRLTQRGPMSNEALVALSGQAAAQLGLTPGNQAAVRVRRVNPPEPERAALRTGGAAPRRMDTPEALLKVLRRKLAEQSRLLPPPSTPPSMPTSIAALPGSVTPPAGTAAGVRPADPMKSVRAAETEPEAQTEAAAVSTSAPAPTPAQAPPASTAPLKSVEPESSAKLATSSRKGTHVVQVAAFSSRERADKAAKQLRGRVSPAGRFWRLQLGPFESRGQAASALEKAKAAGYSDARIQRTD